MGSASSGSCAFSRRTSLSRMIASRVAGASIRWAFLMEGRTVPQKLCQKIHDRTDFSHPERVRVRGEGGTSCIGNRDGRGP
jgi:hypothetical protein